MDFNSAPNFSSFPPGSFVPQQQGAQPHQAAFAQQHQPPFAAHNQHHIATSSSPSPYQSLDPHARFQQPGHAHMAANFPSSSMNMNMNMPNSHMLPPGMANQQHLRGEWLPIRQSNAFLYASVSLIYAR